MTKATRAKREPSLNSLNRGWMSLLESLETAIKVAKTCLFEPCKLDRVCHCQHNLKQLTEAVERRLHRASERTPGGKA